MGAGELLIASLLFTIVTGASYLGQQDNNLGLQGHAPFSQMSQQQAASAQPYQMQVTAAQQQANMQAAAAQQQAMLQAHQAAAQQQAMLQAHQAAAQQQPMLQAQAAQQMLQQQQPGLSIVSHTVHPYPAGYAQQWQVWQQYYAQQWQQYYAQQWQQYYAQQDPRYGFSGTYGSSMPYSNPTGYQMHSNVNPNLPLMGAYPPQSTNAMAPWQPNLGTNLPNGVAAFSGQPNVDQLLNGGGLGGDMGKLLVEAMSKEIQRKKDKRVDKIFAKNPDDEQTNLIREKEIDKTAKMFKKAIKKVIDRH